MSDEIEQRIAQILKSMVPELGGVTLTPDMPLVEGGLNLDSVNLLELIVGLEETFGITVEDNELSLELISTVGSLANHVRAKLSTQP